jgi:peroxiredoxin
MLGINLNTADENSMDLLRIGDKAPYFCLPGTDGLIHSLSNHVGSPCFVIIFTSNHCPYAKSYETKLASLYKKYRPFGVDFIAICSNDGDAYPEDSFENMKQKNFPYPYLHDESQDVARAFGAQATPEVFVFDAEQTLRYHGAIDDNPEQNERSTQRHLEDAINAILNSSSVKLSEAPFIGCSIKWSL